MVDQNVNYIGYTTTPYVESLAAVEDDQEWTKDAINKKIKAAEGMVNNAIKPTMFYPYKGTAVSDPVPAEIAEATAFYASALINGEIKEKEPLRDSMYMKHITVADKILASYLEGSTFTAQLGDTVLSDYSTSPANPNAEPYLTGEIK